MIINKTKYTEKDFSFIYSRWKHDAKYYIRLVFSLMIDIFALVYSFYIIGIFLKKAPHVLLTPISLILTGLVIFAAARSIYRTFTRKKNKIASWAKQEAKCTDRTMTFCDDGVIVNSVKNGITTETKYGFDLVKGYTSVNDCLYIRTVLADNHEIYIIMHDNCYTEGSKADAEARLKAIGVPEENV